MVLSGTVLPYALHVFIEAMALIVAVVRSRYQTSYPDGVRSRMPQNIECHYRTRIDAPLHFYE